MDTVKDRVISLLWAGKPAEARKAIDAERAKLTAALRELDSLMPQEQASGTLFNGAALNGGAHVDDFNDKQLEVRRARIMQIAKSLARTEPNSEVLVPAIVELANQEGVNLGVQKDRETQAVANILRRSPDLFRKTAKNVYEYVGK